MNNHAPLLLAFAALCMSFSLARAADNTQGIVADSEIAPGPFKADKDSLKTYQCPAWFRDAKLGFWAHWGPQAVPRQGDWYARGMYQSMTYGPDGKPKYPSAQYKYHVAHYGSPADFGYKDLIKLWTAEKWDPEKLMALYKKAGARYFVSMGVHHDNFSMWNSKLNRWNAVNYGPKKDVVALWQKAARKEGLRFGVSEHLVYSYTWFQTSHGTDFDGPKKGVPYDGADPKFQDLYHPPRPDYNSPELKAHTTTNPDDYRDWFNRIKELVDVVHPDLLYSDCGVPFGNVGEHLIAHYYNQSAAQNGGKTDVVYNCKVGSGDSWVKDLERGRMRDVQPHPWQTDTSVGDWFYRTGQKYKTSGEIIQMLTDIISKNGNLLINIVQTPEGDLEPDVLKILDDLGAWTSANGEAVYGSRPWRIAGEGPSMNPAELDKIKGRSEVVSYTSKDIRFTTHDGALYLFCLGAPEQDIQVKSLAAQGGLADKPVQEVQLLGSSEKTGWKQNADALVIQKPAKAPFASANVYRIRFATQ